jgi:hypothetical protein
MKTTMNVIWWRRVMGAVPSRSLPLYSMMLTEAQGHLYISNLRKNTFRRKHFLFWGDTVKGIRCADHATPSVLKN